METTKSRGTRLRSVREAQGRSVRSLAREAGIDPTHLSRIERGLRRPSVEVLVTLGKALGLKNLVDTLELFQVSRL